MGSIASITALALPLLLWAFLPKKKVELISGVTKSTNKSKEINNWKLQQQKAQSGREYLDNLLLDNKLTNLVPIQQLDEAKIQFDKALKSCDVSKAQEKMQEYLRLARAGYGSTDTYDEILSYCRTSFKILIDDIEASPKPK